MTAIRNLDHTVLLCDNLPETRAFYRDVMKFPIESDLETWVSFRVGSSLLSLRPRGNWPIGDDGGMPAASAPVQLAFRVPPAAIDSCHEELLAHGVPIMRGPTDLPNWRHRTIFFRDPENTIIEIYAEY